MEINLFYSGVKYFKDWWLNGHTLEVAKSILIL